LVVFSVKTLKKGVLAKSASPASADAIALFQAEQVAS